MLLRRVAVACLASLSLAALVGGCSGKVEAVGASDGGATDASPADARADASGDAGCVSDPVEGATCRDGDVACATGGDACCVGYLSCDASSHLWRRYYLGCACAVDGGGGDHHAGPEACGTMTCTGNTFCTEAHGGAQPLDGGSNTSYGCGPLPAACDATPTCACLKGHGGGGGCVCQDIGGHPYVTCDYP